MSFAVGMTAVIAVIIALELAILQKLYAWTPWLKPTPPAPIVEPPDTSAIEAIVKDVFGTLGLPIHQFEMSFDLQKTGKMQEILHLCGDRLGIDHGLHTVGDVVAYLHKRL